jgi:hypothetical protein
VNGDPLFENKRCLRTSYRVFDIGSPAFCGASSARQNDGYVAARQRSRVACSRSMARTVCCSAFANSAVFQPIGQTGAGSHGVLAPPVFGGRALCGGATPTRCGSANTAGHRAKLSGRHADRRRCRRVPCQRRRRCCRAWLLRFRLTGA